MILRFRLSSKGTDENSLEENGRQGIGVFGKDNGYSGNSKERRLWSEFRIMTSKISAVLGG